MDKNRLAHMMWEYKYHIVFAPKFRRKVIYQQLRADTGRILSDLCKRKGKNLLMMFEGHANLKYKYGNRHF